MGVTIHYGSKNKTQSISKERVKQTIDFVRDVAKGRKWTIWSDRKDILSHISYDMWGKKYETLNKSAYRVWQRVISIQVYPNCEDTVIGFHSFDNEHYKMGYFEKFHKENTEYHFFERNFTKTQFAGVKAHIEVAKLLEAINNNFYPMNVYDEGDYYKKGNVKRLADNLGQNMDLIRSVEATLGGLGFKQDNIHSAKDDTKGWVKDYIDYLARKIKK